MDYDGVLAQVLALLQQEQRLSYRVLKRRLHLEDDLLDDLKEDLIYAKKLAVDEDGRVLVWAGGTSIAPTLASPVPPPAMSEVSPAQVEASPGVPPLDAERRQLTVLFCDVVDSTRLSVQLDPEDFREVIRAYQATCATVIQRFDGHIAQYLGDGLLVYFGYPQAHEDDAQRAVRTGLDLVAAMADLNNRLEQEHGLRLAVRLGIHTGVVVVGEMGGGGRQEQLALGETPNIAARLQGLAAPDMVAISEATAHLIQGYFVCQSLGSHALKGLVQPLMVYRVLRASGAQTRLDVAAPRGLTRLVGREQEVGLLVERWERATEGMGQVAVLTGEAGIGKSRLVHVLRDQIVGPAATCIECRCSPHTQQSALYPVIAHLERALAFTRHDTSADKLHKLEDALTAYAVPLAELVPLFAALLSLPPPAHYLPLTLTPQRQRQKTLEALLTWLAQETGKHPVLFIVEDLHWVDPSTLEFLSLLVDQSPTIRIAVLLTCRPEFTPSWPSRAHLTSLTLSRLPQPQVERMVASVAGTKALPGDVVHQIVAKTDGVPLFVEELTKTVLESGLLREYADHYELTGPLPALAIPATLQDSLMARLDRLSTVKTVAQLGATIGRQFAYDLLQAISPLDEGTLQQGLRQLVEAELLYQRGIPPQATYSFKHALIQDAAYQSLLKSTRQHSHQRIAQVLEAQFPETVTTQPELLAHHYTEAGLVAQALPYWQRAGQRAIEGSAHQEALSHLTQGLALLRALPDTPERTLQELDLQLPFGAALLAAKGYASPDVESAYGRARVLCRQVANTPQLLPVLIGLILFYLNRAEYQTAYELGEQCHTLAQRQHDPALLLEAHMARAMPLFWRGQLVQALTSLEQGIALYDPQQHRAHAFLYGQDPGVVCRHYASWSLWLLGYPEQALQRSQESLRLGHELGHTLSLTYALCTASGLHQLRREGRVAHEQTEAALALSIEHGFPFWFARATIMQGWALVEQGQGVEGITKIEQGLAARRAMGAEIARPWVLGLLAEAYGRAGQVEEGMRVLAEALTLVDNTGEHVYEAEIQRLKGELLLVSHEYQGEAESCFHQALVVARRQEAKSLELRAAMSLSRLWQQQGKDAEAHTLLAPIYGWFTEGFDTADLRDAKALLEELAG